MSGSMSVKEASENILLEFNAKEEAIKENIKTQKHVILTLKSADKAYNKWKNVSVVEELREAMMHKLNERVTKYNELCKKFKYELTFYTELITGHLKPLHNSVSDFLAKRMTERNRLLKDLNKVTANKIRKTY